MGRKDQLWVPRYCLPSSLVASGGPEGTRTPLHCQGASVDKESGEVADPVDRVLGEEGLGQLSQIQPLERCAPESAVVEIESIYVDVRDQSLHPDKDRDRLEGRSRPDRRSGRGGAGDRDGERS